MSRAIRYVRNGVFALGIAAALGFGAREAFARVPECTDPAAEGHCSTDQNCDDTYCGGFGGSCENYCCYCF